ncbi:MAG: hypothetical protein ACPG4U_12305 [Pseudomonadales bacterium]
MIATIAAMLIWALFSTAVSPSYLLEGLANHGWLTIVDKASYVELLNTVSIGYKAVWGILIVLALWTKHQWVKAGTQ